MSNSTYVYTLVYKLQDEDCQNTSSDSGEDSDKHLQGRIFFYLQMITSPLTLLLVMRVWMTDIMQVNCMIDSIMHITILFLYCNDRVR